MSGGLLQLVAYGKDNLFLTDDPQITYFKMIYKRHTNFSIESIPQFFNTKPNFGSRVTATISKNGDLINKMYLVVNLPALPKLQYPGVCRWVDNIGFALIKSIELEIGGKLIDKQYGDYMFIWNELTKTGHTKGLDKLIGNVPELIQFSDQKDSYELYIPLYFWFCRNTSYSLPLIALDYAEVKIHVDFSNIEDCLILAPSHSIIIDDSIINYEPYEILRINNTENYVQYINLINNFDYTNELFYLKTDLNYNLTSNAILTGIKTNFSYNVSSNINEKLYYNKNTIFNLILNSVITSSYLLVDYIYLDNDERIKFARSNHEYLIDVLQFDNDKICFNSNNKIKLGYSHPVKDIIVRSNFDYITSSGGYWRDKFNYTISPLKNNNISLIKDFKILLNGIERELTYPYYFHYLIQSYQHHNNSLPNGVFYYSFSLNPLDIQPSGTCNFSKIDDITLQLSLDSSVSYNKIAKIRIYVKNYNIFRILDGIPGLAFEN